VRFEGPLPPEHYLWRTIANELIPEGSRDLHFHPDYAAAQRSLGVESLLFALVENDRGMAMPLVVRRTRLGHDGPLAVDIASPYGYGGPISWKPPKTTDAERSSLARAFYGALGTWAREQGIICEYCVLHPFLPEQELLAGEVVKPAGRKTIVWMDLTRRTLLDAYRPRRIAGIKSAWRAGLVAEKVEASENNFAIFSGLYQATMNRVSAAGRFLRLDEQARELIRDGLGSLFFVRTSSGGIEVAGVMLMAYRTGYYHLSGRCGVVMNGANDLMVHEMALRAKAAGATRFHLGGGPTPEPDDSVFQYKAGFGQLRAPVRTYFRVLDDTAYRQACLAKIDLERAELGHEIDSMFQPLYLREAS
jgi:hypothetical protein